MRNMSRSAAGTAERPGRNVRAKSCLNKAILDQGWFEFRRQLDYKLAWRGGRLVLVPPQNTSRTCPACGHVAKENRQTQAIFACVQCGFRGKRRCGGRNQCFKGGTRPDGLWIERLKPSEAGTHRGGSGRRLSHGRNPRPSGLGGRQGKVPAELVHHAAEELIREIKETVASVLSHGR